MRYGSRERTTADTLRGRRGKALDILLFERLRHGSVGRRAEQRMDTDVVVSRLGRPWVLRRYTARLLFIRRGWLQDV